VRVICATNRNLRKEVAEGRFREDLYYRLSVVKVQLLPFANDPEDIPLLIERLLANSKFNHKPDGSLHVTRVEDDALKMLMRYQWPGNVRELVNILERAVPWLREIPSQGNRVTFIFNMMDQEEDEATERMSFDMNLPFKEAKQKIVEHFEKIIWQLSCVETTTTSLAPPGRLVLIESIFASAQKVRDYWEDLSDDED
jgi:transcriptional regulator with PAS, ATPase and Fis domain